MGGVVFERQRSENRLQETGRHIWASKTAFTVLVNLKSNKLPTQKLKCYNHVVIRFAVKTLFEVLTSNCVFTSTRWAAPAKLQNRETSSKLSVFGPHADPLKETPSQDASWPENVEIVQTFALAGFVWLFCQIFMLQRYFFLFSFSELELFGAQRCCFAFFK